MTLTEKIFFVERASLKENVDWICKRSENLKKMRKETVFRDPVTV